MKFKIGNTVYKISYIFLLTVTLILLLDRTGVGYLSILSIVIHESGHVFVMKILKIKISAMELFSGRIKIIHKSFTSDKQNLFIALGGPIMNLLFVPLYFLGNSSLKYFALCNMVIALFNLMPIKGLDGGDIIFYSLRVKGSSKYNILVNIISYFFIILIIIFGGIIFAFVNGNITLIIVGIYLFILSLIKV